ncbi:uncharacterized protein N7443_005200 [Penicillium atrosanguineum]|uniref:uncharacterized protein n=1 Tax=Penicillium atrosanguineum TaxID=1132637 RepID=UPI002387DA53|nr:uncharacterized protein N7443_005200 [Penicillium atrosanguineum]KAJ5133167.1 hypothetical protein N7526_004532 [Penicillium atrosanguineum]KAJ5305540.1 hypothetical protein N7443_005200 [Penicillium atrosanguineum]
MPDMPAVFHSSTSPPKLDLASANSQLFQVPTSASASSSLYSLSVSRKRPRRDNEKLSSKFDFSSEDASRSLLESEYRKTSGRHDFHTTADLDYRPNRYRESFLPPSLDASVEMIDQDTQANSRKRSRRDSCIASPSADGADTPTRLGWGRTVIKAVGKVLDLCWTGAFSGFYAGGGQGYDIQTGSPAQYTAAWQSPVSVEKDSIFRTPIPGQYPDEEIERSWVVVPTEPANPFVGDSMGSPSLKARRIHQASSPRRRPAVMPRLNKRAAPSALRPSTPTKGVGLGLPSPRSRDGPGSAEGQRQAARLRRREREEDASIQRLNKQLQAMIREGKEALGTTVEVDDIEMDYD